MSRAFATSSGVAADVLVGLGELTIKAPSTSPAWSNVGYSIEGCQMSLAWEYEDTRVPWSGFIVDGIISEEDVILSTLLAEASLAHLNMAMANIKEYTAGSHIYLGRQDRGFSKIGAKLVGEAPSGKTRTITMAYGRAVGPVEQVYTIRGVRHVPLIFQVMYDGTNNPVEIVDA